MSLGEIQVLTAAYMKMIFFWDIALLLKKYGVEVSYSGMNSLTNFMKVYYLVQNLLG